jgi:hypothetical protein
VDLRLIQLLFRMLRTGGALFGNQCPTRLRVRIDDVSVRRNPANKQFVTRDIDIRRVLLADLAQKFCDPSHDLIVQEFGCKSARTDVAVINGALHAFEIKSDSDSLDRLPSQIGVYQGVFEYLTLVCGRRLLERARVAIPKWWGLQKVECTNGHLTLRQIRAPQLNPRQNALALARMLWKTEALACLRRHGHKAVTAKQPACDIWQAVADLLPMPVLSEEVRQAIRTRGGSGFARTSIPGDGSCTTESIVQASRSPDLSWLLAPQYQNPPD